jgi:2-polyprenyl-3-methyl-5-hydroxy-6-metoxy-1,4-benzoquinol methylase
MDAGTRSSAFTSAVAAHAEEVARGRRFAFGANWHKLLAALDPARIRVAEESLRRMLGVSSLAGRTFLDVGSGSGLFSLAARRLGACVHSFDYDPQSVRCTETLKAAFFPDDSDWRIEHGSALDVDYLAALGRFDVVYAWGVLHHTGAMWPALESIVPLVRRGGLLYLAIYNDQGKTSRRWLRLKRLYNRLPCGVRSLLLPPLFVRLYGWEILKECVKGRPLGFFRRYTQASRGMSVWRDLVDWAGGYPFEVARPEEIIHFYRDQGFALAQLKTVGGGLGCNEFVFVRQPVAWSALHEPKAA